MTDQQPIWTAADLAELFDVNLPAEWEARGVSIDTRTLKSGDLFVALIGEHSDGHDYVKTAFEKGASAALVSKPCDGVTVQVEDTFEALRDLGRFARNRSGAKFIGVTGSVGKTGTKEMLRAALGACANTYATSGNYNNHYGVPLTLANMPRETQLAVIEMGMNHAGEIRELTQIARPHLSVITTIDAVHLEHFKNVEAIAAAKAEIFEGMGGEGIAVLNLDNPHYGFLAKQADKADLDRIISFGTDEEAYACMRRYQLEDFHSVVDAVIGGTPVQYRIGAIGRHWGMTSVAVLAVADALGYDIAKCAEALRWFEEPEGRGRIEELKVRGGNMRLIDDAYNASPVSMGSAIDKLAMLGGCDDSQPKMRTLAVLGDMLELGDASAELHVGLVPTLVNNQIDLVFAAGHFMRGLYEALPESMRGDYDETALGLAPKVVSRLQANDLVLVKGSNGSKMRELSRAIRENSDKQRG
jgi:UDP-N-acetylmuramoyl-tripeptide--D-alanyl-D-alanine ligase